MRWEKTTGSRQATCEELLPGGTHPWEPEDIYASDVVKIATFIAILEGTVVVEDSTEPSGFSGGTQSSWGGQIQKTKLVVKTGLVQPNINEVITGMNNMATAETKKNGRARSTERHRSILTTKYVYKTTPQSLDRGSCS